MNVLAWFDSSNIPYQILDYPETITAPSAAAEFLGIEQDQMLKSLLVKAGEEFVMVLVPLTQRLDMNVITDYFHVKKARMATPDEVFETTGYKVGYTCPFLLKNPVRVFLKKAAVDYQKIAISSGELGQEIMMGLADLIKVTELTVLKV